MGFSYLGGLGAVDILNRAAEFVLAHGVSSSTPYNVFTGQVTPTAALALACSADIKGMKKWDGSLDSAPVPDIRYGLFMELIPFVESFIDEDMDEWAYGKEASEVADLFCRCATRIEIALS